MKKWACLCFIMLLGLSVPTDAIIASGGWAEPSTDRMLKAIENRIPLPDENEELLILSLESSRGTGSRIYTTVTLFYCEKNTYYNPIGTVQYTNTSGSPMMLQYIQGQTKTTLWNVTENISRNPDLSGSVMEKVETGMGLPLAEYTTTPQSTAVIATMTVPPGKTGMIHAYHSAVEVQGSVLWVQIDDLLGIVGGGKEQISGALIMDGIYLENEII